MKAGLTGYAETDYPSFNDASPRSQSDSFNK
jgi:hypothetical protein